MPVSQINKRSKFSRYLEPILYLIDGFVFTISLLLASYVRLGSLSIITKKEYQLLFIVSLLLWFAIISYKKVFKLFRVQRIELFIKNTIVVFIFHIGIIATFVVFSNFDEISRLLFLYFYSIFFSFIILSRFSIFRLLKLYRSKGYNYRNVLIVGCNKTSIKLFHTLEEDLTFGYRVKGFFGLTDPLNEEINYLGDLNNLPNYIEDNQVDEVYIVLSNHNEEITRVIELCEKHLIRIKFVPDFRNYTRTKHVKINFYGETPVMMFRKEPLEEPLNRLAKKIFDLIFSFMIITLVFSWLFPILAVIIKLSSKGPVFFKQLRSGENNKEFTCFKFRTMSANKMSDELQAVKNDPRITKIGAFMRKNNLDELPQFFNVLYGNMSVIGPRPHMLAHTEQYSKLINNYLVRHLSKPGISGWAQVNGYRGETKTIKDMEGRVKYDIFYIENWSFLLDLKIVWLTVYNMIRGEDNAY
tara:strand:+ start:1061 stop:2470 length:1410 start_codon:yes stop_codon:yes gene_type:complete